jgi:hypothetical protein
MVEVMEVVGLVACACHQIVQGHGHEGSSPVTPVPLVKGMMIAVGSLVVMCAVDRVS